MRGVLELGKEIQSLTFFHQIAFSASICERMLPNYYIFARESNYQDDPLFRTALDKIWLFASSKKIDIFECRQLATNCEKSIPDEQDNHFSGYVSEAQNAAIAISNLLDFCLRSDLVLVKRIVRCAHNTLWEYLNWQLSQSDINFEGKSFDERETIIANHPFTIREIAKENEDLKHLQENQFLTPELLAWLRISSQNNGKSLIDLL